MVVASGGWVQNANCPPDQSNSNLNSTQADEMTAKGIFICRANSHPFQERTLSLEEPVKIGRSVARAKASPSNAIFDCKVLSRNHALLWYSGGKFFLRDTRSSNGTFVNNQRLSASGIESAPKEVCSGDIVQFGVDVIENTRKVTHGCIVATLKLYLPDGKEAKASLRTSVSSSPSTVSLEELYKLNQVMEDALRREKGLCAKLAYLKQLVENTRTAANKSWQALITEDRLLSWVDKVENQLAVYSKKYTEDKIRNELVKLHEEKAQYQNAAKEALEKVLQENLKISRHVVQLEGRLSNREVECMSLHNGIKFAQTELEEMCRKYSETQTQLQETTDKLLETEEKLTKMQEKEDLLKELEIRKRDGVELKLRVELSDSRRKLDNTYKQITSLRNCMQMLQDMIPKLGSGELTDSKDEENPLEAINTILNTLNSMHAEDQQVCKNLQDNQFNSEDFDVSQHKRKSFNVSSIKDVENSLVDLEFSSEYILPPTSRRTLVNGNGNLDNADPNVKSDTISDATDDTCSTVSDDVSEDSIIENKKEEKMAEDIAIPHKLEVRFASEESGEQLVVHYPLVETDAKENGTTDDDEESVDSVTVVDTSEIVPSTIKQEVDVENQSSEVQELNRRMKKSLRNSENENLRDYITQRDYINTLKPSKSDATQSPSYGRDYVLQNLIGSLESLKSEDDVESMFMVKKELEELKDWLICESHDIIIDKLKELYYKAKNESQKVQEVHEELVILKEKYNAFVEEKAELSRKYTTLKTQCGDLLNTTYSVPIHYVAPIVIMLIWMLLEKIF